MGADPLDHVTEAVLALARRDVPTARSEMSAAVSADPSLRVVADAVTMACARLETDGDLDHATWNALADACPTELRDVIEGARS